MPTAKKATINELTSLIGGSQFTVICDYRGLSVTQMQQFRAALRPHDADSTSSRTR